MSKDKINITKEGYNDLLNKVLKNIEEERNMALDRYRYQDAQIIEATDFVLQGKEVVAFLKLASDRTNTMFEITKEIRSIAHADQAQKGASEVMDDNDRKEIEEVLKQMKLNKKDVDDLQNDFSEEIQ